MANRKSINEKTLEIISNLASKGMTKANIARKIGMSPATFYLRIQENPQIDETISVARINTTEIIESKLIEKAMSGDNTCMIFYLKCKAGWNDKASEQQEGAPTGLNLSRIAPTKPDISDAIKETVE